jgi:hypothetical protein
VVSYGTHWAAFTVWRVWAHIAAFRVATTGTERDAGRGSFDTLQ